MTGISTLPTIVPGLSDDDHARVETLTGQMRRKRPRNLERRQYYEYEQGLKDLGIAIPPQLKDVETVVGWPAKAVDAMSRRVQLDGFTLADGSDIASTGYLELAEANHLAAIVPQAHTSTLMQSCAFTFVTAGDTAAGEPEAMIFAKGAEWATGTWDQRRRGLSDALSVVSVDTNGKPDHMMLYTPGRVVIMRREGARWDLRQVTHDLGMPVEILPYRQNLDRPFGSARISRPVMALTDSAVRTLLRTEVSAEFFNAPQRYALGADETAFLDKDGNPLTGWQIMLGRLLTLTRDEEGELPTVGQFTQQSMEPNFAHLRMLAQQFTAETSLPLRSLGIVGDNPESAEAISEANTELHLEIEYWENTALGPAWKRTATSALRLIDDTPAARALYAGLEPRWRDQEAASSAAKADAFTKIASTIDGFAQTEVGLEKAGLTPDEINRLRAELRRNKGTVTLSQALADVGAGASSDDDAA